MVCVRSSLARSDRAWVTAEIITPTTSSQSIFPLSRLHTFSAPGGEGGTRFSLIRPWYALTMPATAPAAFSRIGQRRSFSPAMSTTLYRTVTSESWTKGPTAAIIPASNSGNASGRARNTPAASAHSPEPPRPTTVYTP
ncbi:hypothetical protein BD311DRAFT_805001 [Dichomitus squalens]|uniref:Uncharacterized protein n=1 Tax=Dichomitus squalens TaxID=114155 RepID=A0A4Q9MXE4_9APHY|nr:hypothetical protein BD311DRAFT_805001 [Dichomitus squalens]